MQAKISDMVLFWLLGSSCNLFLIHLLSFVRPKYDNHQHCNVNKASWDCVIYHHVFFRLAQAIDDKC